MSPIVGTSKGVLGSTGAQVRAAGHSRAGDIRRSPHEDGDGSDAVWRDDRERKLELEVLALWQGVLD
jgi:hypothetical protein